jgi:DNA-binding MarR family transcriptional regulator
MHSMMKDIKSNVSQVSLSSLTTYQAGVLQAAAQRNLQRTCDEVLKKYDLTTMQWLLIGSIFNAKGDPLRLTDLARSMGTGLPYITNNLNYLESKLMIDRKLNSLDSRSKIILIADKFVKQLEKIEKELRSTLREVLYEDISEDDFKIYINVVMRLANIDNPSSRKQATTKMGRII